ncbi:MAG: type II toxin-antitoxin system RelE/ParE family toxin [bacterium]
MYKIEYEKRIKKDLKKLDTPKLKYIKTEIEKLALNIDENPNVTKLQGNNPYYRLKLNFDYRVIFTKNDNILTILIIKIGHRREIYKRL